jgi:diketogulonate reductase-like aldo/keto reductase
MDPLNTPQPAVRGPDGEGWPALGLGTWRLGERTAARAAEVRLLENAIEIGYRVIDTAEMYGDGGAERVVGEALARAFGKPSIAREQFRIVSKAYPHHASVSGLERACTDSLRRLQLDTIDLYLLHWRSDVALSETVAGFEALTRKGLVRHWGVSNFDLADMSELFEQPGGVECAGNQVYYSLSERGVEFDLLPWMRARAMPLMAYCPIDGGELSRQKALGALARPLGISATQLALAWLLHQPEVIAIPKAGSQAHLLENWQSRAVELSLSTLRAIDAHFAPPKRRRRLAMR